MKHSVALLQIDPLEEASTWPKAQKASGWKGQGVGGRGWGTGGGGQGVGSRGWGLNSHKELAKTEYLKSSLKNHVDRQ